MGIRINGPGLLLGDVAKGARTNPKTLDHYVRLGLVAPLSRRDNGYRLFDGPDALSRLRLIKALRRRPFKRNLDEIKTIFRKVSIAVLIARLDESEKKLFQFLNDGDLL